MSDLGWCICSSSDSLLYSGKELGIQNTISAFSCVHEEDCHDCVKKNDDKNEAEPDTILSPSNYGLYIQTMR
jgi:hypothetical protein